MKTYDHDLRFPQKMRERHKLLRDLSWDGEKEMMPDKFQYKPIQSEEELEAYLETIKDPRERKKEEKYLRKLRREYLEWKAMATESATRPENPIIF